MILTCSNLTNFLKTQFFSQLFFLGSSVDDEEYQDDHEEDHEPDDHKNQGPRKGGPNLDDSAVGQSDSSGLVNSLDGEDEEDEEDEDTVFDSEAISTENVIKKNAIFSPTAGRRRSRQQSTSLMRHPIEDDNLKDYHEHRLVAGRDPFDISYNLYSMVVCLIIIFLPRASPRAEVLKVTMFFSLVIFLIFLVYILSNIWTNFEIVSCARGPIQIETI